MIWFGLRLLAGAPTRPAQSLREPAASSLCQYKPVMLARRAHQTGSVLQHAIVVAIFGSILELRLHVPVANLDGVEFMRADAPRAHFDRGFGGVEAPFAVGADNRDRKRPVLVANRQDRAVRIHGRNFEAVLGACEAREFGLFGAVLRGTAGAKSFLAPAAPKMADNARGVVGVRRIDDGLRRGLRGIEALLRDGRCAAHANASALQMVQSLTVMVNASLLRHRGIPPPPPWNPPPKPPAAASHAGEAAVALHARHAAVVITAEDAVIARPAALLKTRLSKAACRASPRNVGAPALPTESPAGFATDPRILPKAVGHLAIGIRHAQPVLRIMRPHRAPQAIPPKP